MAAKVGVVVLNYKNYEDTIECLLVKRDYLCKYGCLCRR